MPYANDLHGVYRIVNTATSQCYVGSSRGVRKRLSEHFRLLRNGIHPNTKLQESYIHFGPEAFSSEIEVLCEDENELHFVEECFLKGEAEFKESVFFNISTSAKAPMKARFHTETTRQKISESKRKNLSYLSTPQFRQKLKDSQNKRLFSNPTFVEKVKFIVDNDHLSYAERGRRLGIDTSSARKLALKYSHLKGKL